MKKIAACFLVCSMLLGICACNGSAPADTDASTENTQETSNETNVTSSEQTTVNIASDTVVSDTPVTLPDSIKILAIGNSFSTDCMEYLWRMLKSAGVSSIVLGNLYYGGCTMAQHLSFATSDSASYTYYKNTKGVWISTANYKMSDALGDEEWDIITLQESSKTCGVESAYKASYAKLVDYVSARKGNAKLVWNMTWAYQQDSTHSSFPNYGSSQTKMYSMLVDCAQKYPVKDSNISYIIPVGTAVQNARTSYLGDHITRDGYHLNKNFGRYLAALCWTCAITGVDPGTIEYNPAPASINDDMVSVARESVNNALSDMYAVTESQIKTGEGTLETSSATTADPTEILNPEDFYESDKKIAAANGVNLDNYTLLKWEYLENTYWNCTSKAGTTSPSSSGSTYHQNVCSKQKYSLDEVPQGTVFICDSGWQYRIELYNDTVSKFDGSRPSLSTAEFFELSQDFTGSAKYLAWNIASSPKSDISAIYAQAAVHIRVYLPNK